MMLASIHLFAGLGWDPAIRGILVVTLAVAILMGSVYLLLATNTGARLGLNIALAALFGWLSILTLYWWITPPGIGPRGQDPTWVPLEIYIHQPDGAQGPAKTEVLNQLPAPSTLPTAAEVYNAHQDQLAGQLTGKPENATLGDIAGIKTGDADFVGANILKQYYGLSSTQPTTVEGADVLNGWKVLTTSQAGDASATADTALAGSKLFTDATQYKKVGAFEIGGDQTLTEACPESQGDRSHDLLPPDLLCRTWYRIRHTFNLFHPPRYQVIQVQAVIPQEAQPGQAPPVPQVDPTKPVISVVMIRDQGNVRAKPAYFFVICFSLFIVFVLMLHYRDKTLQKHLDEAEALKAGTAVAKVEK
jgi:hypothetical protein